jgi:hypothetical protein
MNSVSKLSCESKPWISGKKVMLDDWKALKYPWIISRSLGDLEQVSITLARVLKNEDLVGKVISAIYK